MGNTIGFKRLTLTSVVMAEKFNMRHTEMLRSIRNLIKKNPYLNINFTESYYIDKSNRKSLCYTISDDGEIILNNKFQYNVRSSRFETKFGNELIDFCKSLNCRLEKQYSIGNKYKIDFYLPEFNTAIEYDEHEHKYKLQQDLVRQKEIESIIGCKFIRISEAESVGEALAKITYLLLKQKAA